MVISLIALASCLTFLASLAEAAPINGKIAFQTDRDGNFEIYVMNPDGTGQVNISNNPGSKGVINAREIRRQGSTEATRVSAKTLPHSARSLSAFRYLIGGRCLYTFIAGSSRKVIPRSRSAQCTIVSLYASPQTSRVMSIAARLYEMFRSGASRGRQRAPYRPWCNNRRPSAVVDPGVSKWNRRRPRSAADHGENGGTIGRRGDLVSVIAISSPRAMANRWLGAITQTMLMRAHQDWAAPGSVMKKAHSRGGRFPTSLARRQPAR
jgi:TolB protein